MPWMYDPPRQVRQRIRVIAPRRFVTRPPAPQEVGDKHFSISSRMEVNGNTFTLLLGYTAQARRGAAGRPGVVTASACSRRAAWPAPRCACRCSTPTGYRACSPTSSGACSASTAANADSLREIVVRQELELALATEVLKVGRRQVAARRPGAGQARRRQQHAQPLRSHAGRRRQGAAAVARKEPASCTMRAAWRCCRSAAPTKRWRR